MPCDAPSTGQFQIRFVRLKEFGPDLVFTEKFRWTPGSVEASLNFWGMKPSKTTGLRTWNLVDVQTERWHIAAEFLANRGRGNYGSHKLVRLRPRSLTHLHLRSAQISTRKGE
jgi:hypothetical protein